MKAAIMVLFFSKIRCNSSIVYLSSCHYACQSFAFWKYLKKYSFVFLAISRLYILYFVEYYFPIHVCTYYMNVLSIRHIFNNTIFWHCVLKDIHHIHVCQKSCICLWKNLQSLFNRKSFFKVEINIGNPSLID